MVSNRPVASKHNSLCKIWNRELQKENFVYKKAYELIDKAVKQLEHKKGYIFLVYHLDLLNYLKDLNTREEGFKKVTQSYVRSLNLKDTFFEMIHENELFGEVRYSW